LLKIQIQQYGKGENVMKVIDIRIMFMEEIQRLVKEIDNEKEYVKNQILIYELATITGFYDRIFDDNDKVMQEVKMYNEAKNIVDKIFKGVL
jgi:hypothetical protein